MICISVNEHTHTYTHAHTIEQRVQYPDWLIISLTIRTCIYRNRMHVYVSMIYISIDQYGHM